MFSETKITTIYGESLKNEEQESQSKGGVNKWIILTEVTVVSPEYIDKNT